MLLKATIIAIFTFLLISLTSATIEDLINSYNYDFYNGTINVTARRIT